MASQFRGKNNNYIRYKRTSLSLFNFIDSTAIFIVLSLRLYMIVYLSAEQNISCKEQLGQKR